VGNGPAASGAWTGYIAWGPSAAWRWRLWKSPSPQPSPSRERELLGVGGRNCVQRQEARVEGGVAMGTLQGGDGLDLFERVLLAGVAAQELDGVGEEV
jgi:hypothetical protein